MAVSQTVQLWDYWYLLRKRKWMILATMLVILFIVTLVNTLQRPIYSASADLIVEINQPTRILSTQPQYSQAFLDNIFFDTQARLMQSSYFKGLVAEELLNKHEELPVYLRDARKDILTTLVRPIINVPTLGSARIIRIMVEDFDPNLAAHLANTMAKVYIRYTQESQFDSSRQTIIVLMQKLEELSAASKIYGENHPIVLALKAKKKELEHSLIERGEISPPKKEQVTDEQEATSGQGQEDKNKTTFSYSPEASEELYQVLLKKIQELDVTRDVSAFNIRVIEPAKVPQRPVRPNKRLNTIIGIAMGLVMGTGLAFFREYLDTTIKTLDDLKNFNLPVLGLIPSMEEVKKPKSVFEILRERFSNTKKKITGIGKDEIKDELSFHVHRLASREEIEAPIGEAYRSLRTNLQFVQLDKPLKTILITSAIRGEGKTTTAVNLGIILAQTGKKVLIIDTDLRRPRIHKAFESGREVGLTNLLLGESRLEDVVISTDVQNLDILPSGPLPPNPAELVSSERMKNLIRYAQSKYDMVLFDSPPLIAVTDPALLATEVDAVLLVVEADALPRDLFKQGLERLNNVKANILGTLLNNVDVKKGSHYYYYYRYYHYDYSHADKT